ncbi:N(4)-acetylcytidine aminohydrolase [Chimaeribacter arupi]|uniref:N(4)-acetylcytidine aminohydrolase n=1 Tax=Chimaeribacter arupi TaxID=2060066 RepID=UPI002711E816|nr:N(4)-acetylcytidine aminohydrolase [Chimaeribacter arupi]WKZ90969.1 N(4)-acetylcytidine aminohydrolase [Chimaeribacter arupi]
MIPFTFYRRFEADILAGRKTITLRSGSDADVAPGDILQVSRLEDGVSFCRLRVLSVTPVAFSALDASHAQQENMTLPELKQVIGSIYPGIQHLTCIEFTLC